MERLVSTTTFGVRDDVRDALTRAGWHTFDALMHRDLGAPVKRKPTITIHRLTLPDGSACYLKRSFPRPLAGEARRLIRWLRRGLRPHTEAFHAKLAADTLGSLGFETMPVVAWGERRLLGLVPRRGVLLARAVEGREAAHVFRAGTPDERKMVLNAAGELLGRLHAQGLCVTLRLHDLILASPPRLVMIDLDFKGAHLRPRAFDATEAGEGLAHCLYLFLRGGDRATRADTRALMQGYRAAIKGRGIVVPPRFLRRVRKLIRHKLADHAADPIRVQEFPHTPSTV